MAQVSHRETDAGDHQIGVKIEDVFVPFATLSKARVAQLVENAKARAAADDEDDEGEGS